MDTKELAKLLVEGDDYDIDWDVTRETEKKLLSLPTPQLESLRGAYPFPRDSDYDHYMVDCTDLKLVEEVVSTGFYEDDFCHGEDLVGLCELRDKLGLTGAKIMVSIGFVGDDDKETFVELTESLYREVKELV